MQARLDKQADAAGNFTRRASQLHLSAVLALSLCLAHRLTKITHLHWASKSQADGANNGALARTIGTNHQVQPRSWENFAVLIWQKVFHPAHVYTRQRSRRENVTFVDSRHGRVDI